jgi:flavin-binding protein dodecin
MSSEGFAKAAENAVNPAAKSVHDLRWFRVTELEDRMQDPRVREHPATVKCYFELEEHDRTALLPPALAHARVAFGHRPWPFVCTLQSLSLARFPEGSGS